jgi:hypothetical protein
MIMTFILIVIIVTSPREVGQWLASVDRWRRYYAINVSTDDHHSMIKLRAKNIKRLRKIKRNAT